MNLNKLTSCILAFSCLMPLAACEKKSASGSVPQDPRLQNPTIIKMKGDPYTFVKDTLMNGGAPLPEEALPEGGQWRGRSFGFQKWQRRSAETEQAKAVPLDERRVSAASETQDLFEGHQDINGEYVLTGEFLGNPTDFIFRPAPGGQWTLNRVRLGSLEIKMKDQKGGHFRLLHTSTTEDLNGMSLLFYLRFDELDLLIDLNLSRIGASPAVGIGKIIGHFKYLFGEDVKIGWPKSKPLELTICSNEALPREYEQMTIQAVNSWQEALETRLSFKADVRAKCPPFSDLRNHGIQFTKDWIEIDGTDAILGRTMNAVSFERSELFDADIFIHMSEFEELLRSINPRLAVEDRRVARNSAVQEIFTRGLLHEMGHFLGLGHQFDPKWPSIMSYDSIYKLQSYDLQAIRALYQ